MGTGAAQGMCDPVLVMPGEHPRCPLPCSFGRALLCSVGLALPSADTACQAALHCSSGGTDAVALAEIKSPGRTLSVAGTILVASRVTPISGTVSCVHAYQSCCHCCCFFLPSPVLERLRREQGCFRLVSVLALKIPEALHGGHSKQ